MKTQSPRRRGELIELLFLEKATSLGFQVCKPICDESYDFILDFGRRLSRVQVKSTDRLRKGGYLIGACHFATHNTKQCYLHRRRNRHPSRLRSPRKSLVHNPHRSLHPPTMALALPSKQTQPGPLRTLPRSLGSNAVTMWRGRPRPRFRWSSASAPHEAECGADTFVRRY
jgi:hypothetical protein